MRPPCDAFLLFSLIYIAGAVSWAFLDGSEVGCVS